MAIFGAKTRSDIDRLIEENDELKNSLQKALKAHQSLEELNIKLIAARKSLSNLSKEEK